MDRPLGRSVDREFVAAMRLDRLGLKLIGLGEDEIKHLLGMPPGSKCADVVALNRRGACVVAECKGASIAHAVEQLNATVPYAKKKYGIVEPMILRNMRAPGKTPMVEIGQCYFAKSLPLSNCHVLTGPNRLEVVLWTGEKIRVTFDFQ